MDASITMRVFLPAVRWRRVTVLFRLRRTLSPLHVPLSTVLHLFLAETFPLLLMNNLAHPRELPRPHPLGLFSCLNCPIFVDVLKLAGTGRRLPAMPCQQFGTVLHSCRPNGNNLWQ